MEHYLDGKIPYLQPGKMMFLIRWHHLSYNPFWNNGMWQVKWIEPRPYSTLIIVVQYSVQKTNPKCNGQNECSSKKIVLAPKSSQRKSYIIHNIEANRETMNKSISIQNIVFCVNTPYFTHIGWPILTNSSCRQFIMNSKCKGSIVSMFEPPP